jgi:hypothetical protein
MISNLLPTYISGGVALFIAVGGIVVQIWRDGKQKKQQEERDLKQNERTQRETIERLLKEKQEQYFLAASRIMVALSMVREKLLKATELIKLPDIDRIDDDLHLIIMIENYYFPTFREDKSSGANVLNSLIEETFNFFAKIDKSGKTVEECLKLYFREAFQKWQRSVDERIATTKLFIEKLSVLDLYKLYSDFWSNKHQPIQPKSN